MHGFTLTSSGGGVDNEIVAIVYAADARLEQDHILTFSGTVPKGRLHAMITSGRDVWAFIDGEELYDRSLGFRYAFPTAGLVEGLRRLDAHCVYTPNVAPVETSPAKP